MKSKKVVLSLLIVILLSKLTWGTPLYTVMHKMDDAGINIVCRDGNKDANDFEQVADNSSIDNTNEPWNLKNKHYAVRRLICKEKQ